MGSLLEGRGFHAGMCCGSAQALPLTMIAVGKRRCAVLFVSIMDSLCANCKGHTYTGHPRFEGETGGSGHAAPVQQRNMVRLRSKSRTWITVLTLPKV